MSCLRATYFWNRDQKATIMITPSNFHIITSTNKFSMEHIGRKLINFIKILAVLKIWTFITWKLLKNKRNKESKKLSKTEWIKSLSLRLKICPKWKSLSKLMTMNMQNFVPVISKNFIQNRVRFYNKKTRRKSVEI